MKNKFSVRKSLLLIGYEKRAALKLDYPRLISIKRLELYRNKNGWRFFLPVNIITWIDTTQDNQMTMLHCVSISGLLSSLWTVNQRNKHLSYIHLVFVRFWQFQHRPFLVQLTTFRQICAVVAVTLNFIPKYLKTHFSWDTSCLRFSSGLYEINFVFKSIK